MIIRSIIFGFALAILPTVAHADTITLTSSTDAPRFASLLSLLPSPDSSVSVPAEAPELLALPTPEPVEAPVEPSPAQGWASSLRAFGRR